MERFVFTLVLCIVLLAVTQTSAQTLTNAVFTSFNPSGEVSWQNSFDSNVFIYNISLGFWATSVTYSLTIPSSSILSAIYFADQRISPTTATGALTFPTTTTPYRFAVNVSSASNTARHNQYIFIFNRNTKCQSIPQDIVSNSYPYAGGFCINLGYTISSSLDPYVQDQIANTSYLSDLSIWLSSASVDCDAQHYNLSLCNNCLAIRHNWWCAVAFPRCVEDDDADTEFLPPCPGLCANVAGRCGLQQGGLYMAQCVNNMGQCTSAVRRNYSILSLKWLGMLLFMSGWIGLSI